MISAETVAMSKKNRQLFMLDTVVEGKGLGEKYKDALEELSYHQKHYVVLR